MKSKQTRTFQWHGAQANIVYQVVCVSKAEPQDKDDEGRHSFEESPSNNPISLGKTNCIGSDFICASTRYL